MQRSAFVLFLGLLAAGCAPQVPDSGSGVGFQDYQSYIRQNSAPPPAPAPATVPAPAPAFDPAAAAAAIDRADGVVPPAPAPLPGAAPAIRPRGNAPAGIQEESGELIHSNAGISDEQDFGAVSSRETIESDAERIARNRSQYVIVQPRDLPVRPGDTGPNIVEYALATTHAPGTQLHDRRGIVRRDPLVACAKYASPDLAQAAFLANGGPDRDRQGLDPDGDGFACSWDPRPFRTALQ